jgi:hypothetical protein
LHLFAVLIFSLTTQCEIAELDYAFKHTALKDDENWDAVEIVEEPVCALV